MQSSGSVPVSLQQGKSTAVWMLMCAGQCKCAHVVAHVCLSTHEGLCLWWLLFGRGSRTRMVSGGDDGVIRMCVVNTQTATHSHTHTPHTHRHTHTRTHTHHIHTTQDTRQVTTHMTAMDSTRTHASSQTQTHTSTNATCDRVGADRWQGEVVRKPEDGDELTPRQALGEI